MKNKRRNHSAQLKAKVALAAAKLLKLAKNDAAQRYALMEQLAKLPCSCNENEPAN